MIGWSPYKKASNDGLFYFSVGRVGRIKRTLGRNGTARPNLKKLDVARLFRVSWDAWDAWDANLVTYFFFTHTPSPSSVFLV